MKRTDVEPSCAVCIAGQLKLCVGLRTIGDEEGGTTKSALEYIPARKTICGRREWPDFIHMICSGWAMSAITHSDGRRQILSFLLPGDGDSTLSIFRPRFGRSIEAITDVLYAVSGARMSGKNYLHTASCWRLWGRSGARKANGRTA